MGGIGCHDDSFLTLAPFMEGLSSPLLLLVISERSGGDMEPSSRESEAVALPQPLTRTWRYKNPRVSEEVLRF